MNTASSTIVQKILIIDDDEQCRASMTAALMSQGLIVRCMPNGRAARTVVSVFQPDVVLIDWMLRSEQNGREVARDLKTMNQALKVILVTGIPGSDSARLCREDGVDAVVMKPFHSKRLSETIKTLTRN